MTADNATKLPDKLRRRRPRLAKKEDFEAHVEAIRQGHKRPLTPDHQVLADGLQRIVDAHKRRREQQGA
jgi:hypothetical protein